MARVLSQKPSFQHLYDAFVQRRTSPIDDYFTSHVCGFCVTSLGLWSGSRSAHQATHQSFPAGMSGATQNCAQVGPSSCTFIFIETVVCITVWYSRGILGWRHFPKMANHENCNPASIGFSETVLISSRIERRAWQVGILERTHPMTTCGISFAGTSFPSKESTTVTGSGVDYCTRDCPSQPVQSGKDAVSSQIVKAQPTELGKSPGGPSTDVCSLESQNQGYHEKSHKLMDRGDCQGSLHSSWSRLWPSYGTWGQSTVSIIGLQLSGGLTWHPVSVVLEVIWGLPEFVLTRNGV